MPRQQAAQKPLERGRNSGQQSGASSTTTTLIQFEPELAVRAIAFHLADEGISPQVAEESIRSTVIRLRRGAVRPTVEQWMWAEMTHAQRLEWLLEKTQTSSRLISDEVSVLEPAKR